jgi:hypothetical protein
MNDEYPIKTTINKRLESSQFSDDVPLESDPATIPTNTVGVYNRPTGISMINSKALPAVIFGSLIIAILIALIAWLF